MRSSPVPSLPKRNAGVSLIEILVTIVILMIGLLGLAGLQGRALTAQMEAYQRSQALILLKDMENRMNANRKNVASYKNAVLGTGAACPPTTGNTIVDADLCEWHNALMGAAEVQSGVAAAGAIIGARGCIYETAASAVGVPGQYMVAVAWQGLNITAEPAVACGSGQYGNTGLRRVITMPVFVGVLN